ncbi:hypothetical protein FKM82_028661 [Ascaphus truei]
MNIPYEADMTSYSPSEQLSNEAFYPEISQAMLARLAGYPQEELLAQALERMGSPRRMEQAQDTLSLQQLIEEGQRRDKEAMYLANLLHLWNQINQGRGYPEQLQGLRGPLQAEGGYQGPYQDYDETSAVSNPIRPQVSRNQMSQALQGRYRQDLGFEGPPSHLQLEEPNEDGMSMDEELLRYLVTRVLSGINEAEIPQHLSPSPTRRLRRSLEEERLGEHPNLLRVKQLEDGNENIDSDYAPPPSGLLRMKRIGRPVREELTLPTHPKRYVHPRVTEQLLKYLPE